MNSQQGKPKTPNTNNANSAKTNRFKIDTNSQSQADIFQKRQQQQAYKSGFKHMSRRQKSWLVIITTIPIIVVYSNLAYKQIVLREDLKKKPDQSK